MAEEQSRLPLTETPEFKEAVRDAVKEFVGALKSDSGELSSGDRHFAETLALALAQLNEQGNGRKYVDPKILRQRAEARDLMFKLIVDARKGKKVPSYRVVAKTLLDNQVVEPMWVDANHTAQPTEIDWPGVPNDAMVPLNDVAKDIHQAFLDSIGSKPVSVLGAVPDASLDPEYGVTAGGLVVKSGAIPRHNRRSSEGRPLPEGVPLSQLGEEGLSVHHKNAPGRSKDIHVLGTIAQPARQNI